MRTRLGIALAVLALLGTGCDDTPPELEVTWGAAEGEPSCVFDEAAMTVEATLLVSGPDRLDVDITVSAYADENTSDEVGSGSRTVTITQEQPMTVTVPFSVDRKPHRDEDGITACRLAFD